MFRRVWFCRPVISTCRTSRLAPKGILEFVCRPLSVLYFQKIYGEKRALGDGSPEVLNASGWGVREKVKLSSGFFFQLSEDLAGQAAFVSGTLYFIKTAVLSPVTQHL